MFQENNTSAQISRKWHPLRTTAVQKINALMEHEQHRGQVGDEEGARELRLHALDGGKLRAEQLDLQKRFQLSVWPRTHSLHHLTYQRVVHFSLWHHHMQWTSCNNCPTTGRANNAQRCSTTGRCPDRRKLSCWRMCSPADLLTAD